MDQFLRVIARTDAKNDGRVFARLPKACAGYWAGLPCFFDKHYPQPEPDTEVTVMVTGIFWHRSKGVIDYDRPPRALFVREVTNDDMLMSHSGFECAGTEHSITAYVENSGGMDHKVRILTPGGLSSIIRFEDNTSCSAQKPRVEPAPGLAYVSKKMADECRNNTCRIVGVPRLADLYFVHVFTPDQMRAVDLAAE